MIEGINLTFYFRHLLQHSPVNMLLQRLILPSIARFEEDALCRLVQFSES